MIDYSKIGHLNGTVFNNPLGYRELITWDWEGPPETLVAWEILDNIGISDKAESIDIGGYRLALIERYPERMQNHYIRKDYPFWWMHVLSAKLARPLSLAFHRLILTLVVWNLADHNPYTVPSWKDIKIVKRLSKR